jgi:mono/diheme cytochrome c family protein
VKRGGNGISVTVWSAIAVGAVGIGVVVAFLAGYFLGHFTGHESTTTVAVATAESGGEIPRGEEPSEEPSGETEAAPSAEAAPAEGNSSEAKKAEGGGKGAGAGAKKAKPEEKPKQGGGGEAAAGNPEAGQEVFATNCSICHGSDGHGGNGGPDLRTMPKAKTEAGAIEQVTNGGGGMPPFKGTLSEEEIENVAAYVTQDVVGGGS